MAGKYVWIESDKEATIDFAGFCQVHLEIETGAPNMLSVCVKGLDDRATILMDKLIDLPDADEDD